MLAFALVATASHPGLADEESVLTALEARGKRIYTEGRSDAEGALTALVGHARIALPASALPCAGCHGPDGRGRPEGGVDPPDITWSSLTKPYGQRHDDGRRHPPFDAASFERAVVEGVDPAGQPLDPAMPLYSLGGAELEALIAYLKRIGRETAPGLSDTTVTVAALLSDDAPGSQDRAFTAAIAARFESVNESGGIFGRHLEMQVYGNKDPTADILARSFAALGPLSAETPPSFAAAAIPRIAPFSALGALVAPSDDQTFFLFSGLTEQARILVDVAARTAAPGGCRPAIVLSAADGLPSVVAAIDGRARLHGCRRPLRISYGGGAADAQRQVGTLRDEDIDTVFYFGPADGLAAFAEAAARQAWFPQLLLSGLHAGRSALPLAGKFGHRVAVAVPTLPPAAGPPTIAPDPTGRQHGLGRETHPVAWAMGQAVAGVLIEGLRRAGRRVDRPAFAEALESLTDLDTGLSPRIGFSPNRHLGAAGAYVLEFAGKTGALPSRILWTEAE